MRAKKKGFTMVELLVVLVIIGILAAVATLLYLANTRRARASEAVATMSLVRQAQRDYSVARNTFFDITSGNIDSQLPTTVTAGVPTPATAGVVVDAAVAQYFSNAAFSVDATTPAWTLGLTDAQAGVPGAPVGFRILADGSASEVCVADDTDCAVQNTVVSTFRLQMDNSGRTFVSYNGGTDWSAW